MNIGVWVKTFKRGDNVILNGIMAIGVVVVKDGDIVEKTTIVIEKLNAQVHDSQMFLMHEKLCPGLWASFEKDTVKFDKAAVDLNNLLNKYKGKNTTLFIIDDSYTGINYLLALNQLPSLAHSSRKDSYKIRHVYRNDECTDNEHPENVCINTIKIV
jgi:hypothetical protein